VLYRSVHNVAKEKGLEVFNVYVGEFATSLEMAGASISLFKLDDELKKLLSKPARTPFFEQVQL
jgi:dihydroxyacetone kinase-like protein